VAEAGQGHQDVCQTEQGQQVVEHALHTSEQRYIKRFHTKSQSLQFKSCMMVEYNIIKKDQPIFSKFFCWMKNQDTSRNWHKCPVHTERRRAGARSSLLVPYWLAAFFVFILFSRKQVKTSGDTVDSTPRGLWYYLANWALQGNCQKNIFSIYVQYKNTMDNRPWVYLFSAGQQLFLQIFLSSRIQWKHLGHCCKCIQRSPMLSGHFS
jgi:hypothetical protein